ncbi:High-affnity carbon uptake protein Hat/HatR [hydrothermal vent metagenome]|uniref:High-affnity carbon uptake protein Hat/HatR n=1 Tax=hydrothermal vent metagenome TaxID=652676 RepID=A0A3B1DPN8_9ZZZZ
MSNTFKQFMVLFLSLTISFALSASLVAVEKKTGKAKKKAAQKKKGQKKKIAKITFDEHVKPIFRDKCFSCHSRDKKKGGLDLTTYSATLEGGGSGESIEKGSAEDSYLFTLVNHDSEPAMPPKADKLAATSITLIRKWIEQGALENGGSQIVASQPKANFKLKDASNTRPSGAAPMPQKMSLEPVVYTKNNTAITAIATSPWAPLVAIAGQQQVLLYNTQTLEHVAVFPFPEGVPYVLKFSRNGSLLLAGGGRGAKVGKVAIWNVKTGKRLFTVGDELDCVMAADISSDQSMIALAGPTRVVRIYSTENGQLLHQIKKHTDWVTTLEFSPDSVLLATGDRSNGLFIWEAKSGQEYLNLKGHRGAITDVSWRSDSNVLASSSEDGQIKIWEMENGRAIKSWRAHSKGVSDIDFNRAGQIASCGRDFRACLWNQNGKRIRAYPSFKDLALRVSYCDETQSVIAGDWTGQIVVWNGKNGKVRGRLSANPLPLKIRFDEATKSTALRHAELQKQLAFQKSKEIALAKIKLSLDAASQLTATSRHEQAKQKRIVSSSQKTISTLKKQSRKINNQKNQKTTRLKQFKKQQKEIEKSIAKPSQKKELAIKLASIKKEIVKITTQIQMDDKTIKNVAQKISSEKQKVSEANKKREAAKAAEKKGAKNYKRLKKIIKPYYVNLSKAKKVTVQAQKQLATAQTAVKKWQTEIAFATKRPPARSR